MADATRPVEDDPVNEAYRRLFESHPAAMAIWDPETGRILAANEAAAQQYGYEPEDLVELTVDRIVHPEDLPRLRAQLPNLPAGLAGNESFRHVRRNGEVIEVEMSGHPLEWEGRPARLVMAIDVTARRRLEQELRSARAIEAVGRLAGGIAHDFNNLVMAINGFAELLLERLPEGSEEHDAAVEIGTAGLRAAGLTSQLLAFARPHEPRPTRFDLNELVDGMDATLRSLSGPNVRVRIAATATQATIRADRDQVARAIVGCVLNARDAMPDGGDLRIETSDIDSQHASQLTGAAADREYVSLALTDSGPTGGQVPESPPIESRTGLGLALVYSTIQMAGGRIRLESTPGHGSTVRILLPIAEAEAEAAPTEPEAGSGAVGVAQAQDVVAPRLDDRGGGGVVAAGGLPERVPVAVSGATGGALATEPATDIGGSALIAVVEDEPGVRSLVERVLLRGGHRVLAYADGAAALDALVGSGTTIDLLITDLVMPGPNGFEVARRFRLDRPDLPVLLMSGYAADTLSAEGIAEGSIEILAKPFSATELLERVAAVLQPVVGGA
jgi:PAS domain S-box-containing protein